MSDKIVLELKNITKVFPGVKALDNVRFDLREGEVHALMGENGAGKSTLIKVITGVYQCDEGEIFFDSKPVVIKTPLEAQKARRRRYLSNRYRISRFERNRKHFYGTGT